MASTKSKSIKLLIVFFLLSFIVTNHAVGQEVNITGNKKEAITVNATIGELSTDTKSTIPDYLIDNPLAIIALFFSFIAFIQTYRFNKYRKKVDVLSGVFKKPNMSLSFYGTEKGDKEDFICYDFIFAGKLPSNGGIILPLLITLKNRGDRSAKEILLEMRYPKRLRGGGLKYAEILPGNDYTKRKSYRISEEKNFQTVGLELGTLTPKRELSIKDVMTITEKTSFQSNLDAKTKDGIELTVSYEVHYRNRIDYTIYQDDHEPISGSLTMQFVDTNIQSIDDYINSYNKQQMKNYRNKFGNIFQQELHKLKVMLFEKNYVKKIQLIYYDESKVKHIKSAKYPNIIVKEVPPEALKSVLCWTDMKDCIRPCRSK